MSDSNRPPIIEGQGLDSNEGQTINMAGNAAGAENDTVPDQATENSGVIRCEDLSVASPKKEMTFEIIKRSDLYWSKFGQMPMMRRPDIDSVCDGNELLICEFSSILRDFGPLGVEAVLNFRDIYQKPDSSAHSKLGEIALIRGVIKMIRNFTVDMGVSGETALVFLKNISLTAYCQDLRELTDLMIYAQYLIQQGARCGCLERALTINWNYLELLLFLNNYRHVMNINGSVIAGEQMKAYLQSAQGSGISRKFLN